MAGMSNMTGRPLDGIAHLRQSVGVILNTPVGSRVMRREFGSRVHELIDRPATAALLGDINAEAADALGRWEPRLRLRQARARRAQGGHVEIDLAGEYLPEGRPVRLDGIRLAAAAADPLPAEHPRGRPVAIRAALSGGPGALAARVTADQGAASRVRASLSGGPGTLSAKVVAEPEPDPSKVRASLTGGPGTLAARVIAQPSSLVRASLSGGPGTLSARVVAEAAPAGIGLNSIPALATEYVRALVTTGAAEEWYNAGSSVGSAEGDLNLSDGILIRRLRNKNPQGFRINTTNDAGFRVDTWVQAAAAGTSAYLLWEGRAEPLVLPLGTNAGGQFLSIPVTAEQDALLDGVGVGSMVNLVIGAAA